MKSILINIGRKPLANFRFWLPILALTLVGFHLTISRQLIVLVAQPVKVAYGLSDTQLGGIVSVAGIVVALAGPFLGQIADMFDRHKLLAVNVLIWAISTAAYSVSGSYMALMLSFVMMAASGSFIGPVSSSLIADRYRGSDRVTANLTFFAAGMMTAGGATLVASLLLALTAQYVIMAFPIYDPGNYWRLTLALVAIAGAPIAAAFWALGADPRPPRTRLADDAKLLLNYWSTHWRTFLPFCLAHGTFSIAAMAIMGWTPIYIVRQYGLTPAELGVQLGTVILTADVFGIIFGLALIKTLHRRFGIIGLRLVFQWSLVPSAALVLALPLAQSAEEVLLLLGLMNLLATIGAAGCINMLQEITPAAVRGKIYGVFVLIGATMVLPGPLLVGILSDFIGEGAGGLLRSVIIVTICALTICFILYASTNKSYVKMASETRAQESASFSTSQIDGLKSPI